MCWPHEPFTNQIILIIHIYFLHIMEMDNKKGANKSDGHLTTNANGINVGKGRHRIELELGI